MAAAHTSSPIFYSFGGEHVITGGDFNHYFFTGKERDSETGLDYFGARYYGSTMGRFLSPDWSAAPEPVPYADLTNPQSLNLYAFVDNAPTNRVDADGHFVLKPGPAPKYPNGIPAPPPRKWRGGGL